MSKLTTIICCNDFIEGARYIRFGILLDGSRELEIVLRLRALDMRPRTFSKFLGYFVQTHLAAISAMR